MINKVKQISAHVKLLKINKVKKSMRLILNSLIDNTNTNKSEEFILTQIVYDYNYISKIFVFCTSLKKIKNHKLIAYDTLIPWGKLNEKFNFLINVVFKNGFHFLYENLIDDLIIDIDKNKHQDDKWILETYFSVISHLNSPKDILEIKFEDILVGDLIYDTYLRYYKKPTINKIDNDVKNVIYKAINVYYNFKKVFNSKKISMFVTTYTTYIQHGIPTRLAIDKGIPVYSISSNTYIFQEIKKDFPYHTKNYTEFVSELPFNVNYDVKAIFESRFSGNIDKGISYMRKSSYSNIDNSNLLSKLLNLKKRNVFIYIHDFYDSPHINRCLLFNDLYDYIYNIFDNIENDSESTFFVKSHPNSVYNSDSIIHELVNKFKYKNIHLLDSRISNNDIIKIKPDLIVTARGTVTIEMAYFNIPVVALFDNPYVNFDFVHTCYSKKEYFDIINGYVLPQICIKKDEILSFYFQYFLKDTVNDNLNLFSIDFDTRIFNTEFDILNSLKNNFDYSFLYKNTQKYIYEYLNNNLL